MIHLEVGYDAGKPVKGRKRHVLVDTLGLLIIVVLTAASLPEREGAKLLFEQLVRFELRTEPLNQPVLQLVQRVVVLI